MKAPSVEEAWHVELQNAFITQYKNYLQDELGFQPIITMQSQRRSRMSRPTTPGGPEDEESSRPRYTVHLLQKTLTSGILLMELGFREQYFCVKMFTYDCSSIVPVNPQMQLLFVDECEKYKDLIHVHSFAHDFHLMCVQKYLRGDDSVLCHGIHLTSLLTDFLLHYDHPPSFSRNCVNQEKITISDLPCPHTQLFDYMLKQLKQSNMRTIHMISEDDPDLPADLYVVREDEYALVSHRRLQVEDGDEYDVSLVIARDHSCPSPPDSTTLRLVSFIILTRRRDCFPLRQLEEKLGLCDSSAELEPTKPVAVKQHIGVRREHVNYRGYSYLHQQQISKLLQKEIAAGRETIEEMVRMSKKKCQRDYLWKRMLLPPEDSSRKKRSETDDSKELAIGSPLTLEEFQELLGVVYRQSLVEVDPRLEPLLAMPQPWFTSLHRLLRHKYPNDHRCFNSADNNLQYIVILHPSNLDFTVMLSIDYQHSRTDLSCLSLEPVVEQERSLPVTHMHLHTEDFVNTCLFHLWTTMLP